MKNEHQAESQNKATEAKSGPVVADRDWGIEFRRFRISVFLRFHKCHALTLAKNNVLAKRTHLTAMIHKPKQECQTQWHHPGSDFGFGRFGMFLAPWWLRGFVASWLRRSTA